MTNLPSNSYSDEVATDDGSPVAGWTDRTEAAAILSAIRKAAGDDEAHLLAYVARYCGDDDACWLDAAEAEDEDLPVLCWGITSRTGNHELAPVGSVDWTAEADEFAYPGYIWVDL